MKIKTRSRLAGVALAAPLLAIALLAPAAQAQSGDMRELLNRLNRLETEVQTLSREVYRGGGTRQGGGGSGGAQIAPSVAGDFEVRLQRLETDVRTMTGRYEEATFQIGQLREQLERLATDMEYRLTQLEQGRGGAQAAPVGGGSAQQPASPSAEPTGEALPPMAAAPSGGAAAPADLPSGGPQQQYDYAFGLLRQQNYAAAHAAFQQFLTDNPGHQLSANAQYWLGETLYVRSMFKEAAVAFAEGYQSYPKSSKAPDNLLKLAMSLGAINQKEDACLALQQLAGEYKDAPTTIRRRAEQEKNRLRCG
ncbi:tol-pal system protein YbgF [Indioceanicola profundi]|uniref:tol-pal system protein YbgF n=1 Tax=Indioceanicola profundi TaxID=2220096 RepID=UPI0013C4445B|nr:tol-pal system protein YbgF [Indioceanicola profundi]